MQKYTVRKYLPTDAAQWNEFLLAAKNATFLFNRNYMEYHSDRFEDYSLMVFSASGLQAVFPANKSETVVYSHKGLTYGGLITGPFVPASDVNAMLNALLAFLKSDAVTEIVIKSIPFFYHKRPSNEMDYFYHRNGALIKRDMNLAIDFSKKIEISKSKLKHFRRVSQLGMTIRKEQQFDAFWNDVLIPRLREKHNVAPVHSLSEIELLGSKFPENIFQYNVYFDHQILAGITLYDFGTVVKSQYGATSETGEKMRALDFLFITLINEYGRTHDFFDMGTVSDNNDLGYNPGLLNQKEELGCSVYNQDHYSISL